MAIEPEVLVACRRRDDAIVRIASTVFAGDVVEISLQNPIKPGEPNVGELRPGCGGRVACRGGAAQRRRDLLISNTLPVGGGLSSSAAIEVGTALALLLITGAEDMDRGAGSAAALPESRA